MIQNLYRSFAVVAFAALVGTTTSCNKLMDITPPSEITPENYLNEESQLFSYTLNMYEWLPSHSNGVGEYDRFACDTGTDNITAATYDSKFVNDEWKVAQSGSAWNFEYIYEVNYFLNKVIPLYEAGQISGSEDKIKHYIGEAYFFRAFAYEQMLRTYGDFPIITDVLDVDMEELTKATERKPRNEVARFIFEDLDRAYELLSETSPDGNRNLMSKPVAKLFKSRVALYEACWLMNFKGTAFVPGGDGWPGATKDYNSDFAYESGSIDNEINEFLEIAIESADEVASVATLTVNEGFVPQENSGTNPYFSMFADVDLSVYPEVLLWRQYDYGLGQTHHLNQAASFGNGGYGLTRGFVMSFLDINGLPWYAPGSLFTDDSDVFKLRENRDNRIFLFLKEPYQQNMWINLDLGTHGNNYEPDVPQIHNSDYNRRYVTGYCSRKGMNPDRAMNNNGSAWNGSITFRSSEAMLNYIEAYYLRYNNLDAKATQYWTDLRARAGITAPIATTIDAIDIAKEAEFDWAAYSAGQLITSKTLMAIRKERRSEFISEDKRNDDLRRWRSLDQLIDNPYKLQGMKYWNSPNYDLYSDADRALIISGSENSSSIISEESQGDYLVIHSVRSNSNAYNGYTWHMAHYLSPIELEHMTISSSDGNTDGSPIYQNPYWPTSAGQSAER